MTQTLPNTDSTTGSTLTNATTSASALSARDLVKVYGEATPRSVPWTEQASTSRLAPSPPSWARRDLGSRPCCTSWPVSTAPTPDRSFSATPS